MKALILIAHGSKKQLSNDEFTAFVEQIKKENTNYSKIKAAFLELATPSIEESVHEFVEDGAKEICFYPYFLNSGKHVTKDIPYIVESLQKQYPSITFTTFEHFGASMKLKDVVLGDIL